MSNRLLVSLALSGSFFFVQKPFVLFHMIPTCVLESTVCLRCVESGFHALCQSIEVTCLSLKE